MLICRSSLSALSTSPHPSWWPVFQMTSFESKIPTTVVVESVVVLCLIAIKDVQHQQSPHWIQRKWWKVITQTILLLFVARIDARLWSQMIFVLPSMRGWGHQTNTCSTWNDFYIDGWMITVTITVTITVIITVTITVKRYDIPAFAPQILFQMSDF